jgi:hypothetical protein
MWKIFFAGVNTKKTQKGEEFNKQLHQGCQNFLDTKYQMGENLPKNYQMSL